MFFQVKMNKSDITAGSVFSQVEPCELQDLQLESSMIGDGTYGEFHIRRYTRFKIPVVEKRLKESDLTELKKEAYYIQLFSHRCVPHLIGLQTQMKPYSLIMEFLGDKTISMTVHRLLFDSKFNDQKLMMRTAKWCRVSYDIADALHYIHEKGYLHCDIKSNNTLVYNQKGYLIDFGKVCHISQSRGKQYKKAYPHIAPEVLNGSPVSQASDKFSLGKIIEAIGEETQNQELKSMGEKSISKLPCDRPTLWGILTTLQPKMAKNY